MRSISFKVEDELPPKKDGANSMWGKSSEAPRLVALRKKALVALAGQPPFAQNIQLTLLVHVGPINDKTSGDLDNFITGVCDGLMAAHPKAKLDPFFSRSENRKIHPLKTIAILEDSQVTKITAEKLSGDVGHWYEIEIHGE